MTQLTTEQAIILTGFTGVMLISQFNIFHEDVERRLGRPVYTHEFASKKFASELRDLYREDCMAIMP